jgi:ribosomal protein S18 acetylase RimI-like enzyme
VFANTLLGFIEKNEVILTKTKRIELSAKDLWDLNLELDWQGLGQIEVKNAIDTDAAALKEFLLEGLGDHSRFLFAPYPYQGDLEGSIKQALSECVQKKTLLYHAWQDGRIIGHFYLGGIQEPVPGLGIAVADRCHGQKLGNLFMTILIAAGHFAGSQAIELTTNPKNSAGFHLYQKVGFVHIGDREITVADGTKRIEHELIYRIAPDF